MEISFTKSAGKQAEWRGNSYKPLKIIPKNFIDLLVDAGATYIGGNQCFQVLGLPVNNRSAENAMTNVVKPCWRLLHYCGLIEKFNLAVCLNCLRLSSLQSQRQIISLRKKIAPIAYPCVL